MPESLPGGEGHKYSASIQIKISRVEDLKDLDGNVIGIKSKLETKKNKTYYPHKECIVSINHKKGDFDIIGDIFKALIDREIFIKVKGWYKFAGNSYRENEILDMLENNPEFMEKMKKLI